MLPYLQRHYEIGHYSWYRTTVHAEYFYELTSEDDLSKLSEIYAFAQSADLPFLIIGWGMNLLFSSPRYSWIIVKNSLSGWSYDSEKKLLTTSSNELIWDIAERLERERDQPLWHRFIGLPGSIGWAIYGNAGCFWLDTENYFSSAHIYDMSSGKIDIFTNEDMHFDYRHSVLKSRPELFIVDAIFDLSVKRERYHSDVDNIDFRENKQPKGNSCGSFWKNPSREVSAGSLIERVGLKGYRHGGARWSELHANFLLCDGESCPPSDLIELVRLTHEKVKRETDYDLVNEVQIIHS